MATAEVPTQASNAELVAWAFEMINQRNIEILKQFWTPETEERFPDRTCHGADEIAAYFEDVLGALSDFRLQPVTITEQGDDVFVQWQMTGTHTGTFMGIAPTGKQIAVAGMDHFVVRDGKVISNFVVFDRMQFAQQIGMMAPDDSRADRTLKGAFNARTKLAARLRR